LWVYAELSPVAHRKDVSAFPDTATISEINDLANLVGLCPTHHWEFDHQKTGLPTPLSGELWVQDPDPPWTLCAV